MDQPLFLGGLPEGYTATSKEVGTLPGLNGAIQRIVVNGEVWDNLNQKASNSKNVPAYGGPPCGYKNPCLNEGICIPQLNDFVCKCPSNKFTGKHCNKLLTKEDLDKPVAFEGNTFLSFSNKIR